jgi:2,4-dienoyl-CoA reductase-like NADH-dependent reductase (Old Yellow Enzyme family)
VNDITGIVGAFADAARIAYEIGFDGVEVHAAHGYLVDEFLWPGSNRRHDRYGGSPANRARLAAEIVAAIRARTDPGFPILVRFSQFKERDYRARIAETPAELAELLDPIVQAGADVLHASQRRFWEPAFPGSPLNLAGWAKRLTGLPSITVGSVGLTRASLSDVDGPGSLAALAERQQRGEFDLVAIGRALLANPDLVARLGAGALTGMQDFRKAHEDVYF